MFLNHIPRTALIPAALAVLSTGVFLAHPEQVFQAATSGVEIWWKVVFPALMPYFILTELLLASGIIHFCGRLITPLSSPLSGLPGASLWVLLCGWIGGYPAGAKATVAVLRQGLIASQQSERLLALSHVAAPAFIATVIAAGFMRMPQLAIPLLFIQWGAILCLALCFAISFPSVRTQATTEPPSSLSIWKQAHLDMQRARQRDGRSFGQLLGDTVKQAIEQLFAIGGIMIFCSVAATLLQTLLPFSSSTGIWIQALLEVHLGVQAVAISSLPNIKMTVAIISGLLGFSGLAMLLQVRALTAKEGIRFRFFLYTRLLHAAFAFILTLLLWEPMLRILSPSMTTALMANLPFTAHDQGIAALYVWAIAAPVMSLVLFGVLIASAVTLLGIKQAAASIVKLLRRAG